jgi:hypothetical protein
VFKNPGNSRTDICPSAKQQALTFKTFPSLAAGNKVFEGLRRGEGLLNLYNTGCITGVLFMPSAGKRVAIYF